MSSLYYKLHITIDSSYKYSSYILHTFYKHKYKHHFLFLITLCTHIFLLITPLNYAFCCAPEVIVFIKPDVTFSTSNIKASSGVEVTGRL